MLRTSNSTKTFIQVLVLSFVVIFLASVSMYFVYRWFPSFRLYRHNSRVFIESVSGMGAGADIENGGGRGSEGGGGGGGVILTENDIRLETVSNAGASASASSRSVIPSSIRKEDSTKHRRLLLLGDSTLDNAMYVPPGKSVYSILRGASWDYNPIMYAGDGFTIADVYRQVGTLPIEYNSRDTVIVLSVGGNDFLSGVGYPTAVVDYRHLIERIRDGFGESRLFLMNLYQPADPALAVFRIVVKKWNKFLQGLVDVGMADGIIDIYGVLGGADDFVHKIEPSVVGGEKIVEAIVGAVG